MVSYEPSNGRNGTAPTYLLSRLHFKKDSMDRKVEVFRPNSICLQGHPLTEFAFREHPVSNITQAMFLSGQSALLSSASHSVRNAPIFKHIMGKRVFFFKCFGHERITLNITKIQRFPISDALLKLTDPFIFSYIQLGTTGCDAGSIMCSYGDGSPTDLESGPDSHQ